MDLSYKWANIIMFAFERLPLVIFMVFFICEEDRYTEDPKAFYLSE
jgi:hypothetical protein